MYSALSVGVFLFFLRKCQVDVHNGNQNEMVYVHSYQNSPLVDQMLGDQTAPEIHLVSFACQIDAIPTSLDRCQFSYSNSCIATVDFKGNSLFAHCRRWHIHSKCN